MEHCSICGGEIRPPPAGTTEQEFRQYAHIPQPEECWRRRGGMHEVFCTQRGYRRLHKALEKAVVQITILRDRMEGCQSMTDVQRRDQGGHGLSLWEVPAWVEEHKALLAALEVLKPHV